jgi:16S rRNA (cytosine1402-N4)-methyltransferase
MPREVVSSLKCSPGGVYVDGTVGGGGHAAHILEASAPDGRVIGMDVDGDALVEAAARLKPYGDRVTLIRENFRAMRPALDGLGVGLVDGVVLDLGVSSYQLERAQRGFSFRFDAPLDMRMDTRRPLTAHDLVNGLSAEELERIFREYGEEKDARRVARAIVKERGARPIATTGALAEVVSRAVRPDRGRAIHPATKVFQALRMAVNEELENLTHGLNGAIESLKSGGRLVVISFHSLEDRIVKNAFRLSSAVCVCPPRSPKCVCGVNPLLRLPGRRALKPSLDEVGENPRARSARLRVAERV